MSGGFLRVNRVRDFQVPKDSSANRRKSSVTTLKNVSGKSPESQDYDRSRLFSMYRNLWGGKVSFSIGKRWRFKPFTAWFGTSFYF